MKEALALRKYGVVIKGSKGAGTRTCLDLKPCKLPQLLAPDFFLIWEQQYTHLVGLSENIQSGQHTMWHVVSPS